MTTLLKDNLPKRYFPLFQCTRWNESHKEIAVMIPLGWTTKPQYHLEYLAESRGLKSKWLMVTLDWFTKGNPRYKPGRPNWRLQRQVKHYGTRLSYLVEK